MQLNNFSPESREYTHSSPAIENPRGDGFLPQAFTTPDPLPELTENSTAVRNDDNSKWLIVSDYRGHAWSTETKQLVEIYLLGPLSEDLTILEPGKFDQWVGTKWVKDTIAELAHHKAQAIQSISTFAAETRQLIAGAADHYQTAGWADKRARAMRIKLGTPELDDIQIVQVEVDKREKGETVDQLVERQLEKAKKIAFATYDIDGIQKAAIGKINAVTDASKIPVLLAELKENAEREVSMLIAS